MENTEYLKMLTKQIKDPEEKHNEKASKNISAQQEFEARSNLNGFFGLLLKIEMRLKKNKNKLYDDHE